MVGFTYCSVESQVDVSQGAIILSGQRTAWQIAKLMQALCVPKARPVYVEIGDV